MVNIPKIVHSVKMMLINNFQDNFYHPTKDNRKKKYRIYGSKMRSDDLEYYIKKIIFEKNIINEKNIYNTIINVNNNILNILNNYNYNYIGTNLNLYYYIKKYEDNINIKLFQSKLDKIVNRPNPLVLILFPNFKWIDIIEINNNIH